MLATTLTRLVLDVATTRLVLTRGGQDKLDAAGGVVKAFGEFVSGDQVVVGVILFLILVVIQFVVITNGATRISEVAARFMLDGLPGRQMAIDADLHAGLIDHHEAHRRREAVYRQADFFGDGRRGQVRPRRRHRRRRDPGRQHHRRAVSRRRQPRDEPRRSGQCLHQADDRRRPGQPGPGVPDLAGRGADRDPQLVRDRPRPRRDGPVLRPPRRDGRRVAFLALLAFTPLPKAPLLTLRPALGVAAYFAGWNLERRRRWRAGRRGRGVGHAAEARPRSDGRESPRPTRSTEPASERMEDLLHVDPLELEIGYRLITLAEPTRGGDLLDRLRSVRHRVARDLGLIVPQVRIHDEIGLGPHDYRLKLRGTAVGQGVAYAGRLLAVPPGRAGLPARRPRRRRPGHRPAGRLDPRRRPRGRRAGRLPHPGSRGRRRRPFRRDRAGPRRRADEPRAGRAPARTLRAATPALVDEVVPGLLRAGELQRVLQNLLRERVSIRDMETILETLAVHAGRVKDADILTEQVRCGLARRITEQYRGERRPAARGDALARGRRPARRGRRPVRHAARRRARHRHRASIILAVARAVVTLVEAGYPPVVLASAEARPVLKDLTRADLPRLAVLSQREIPRDTPVEYLGAVVEDEPPTLATVSTSTTITV